MKRKYFSFLVVLCFLFTAGFQTALAEDEQGLIIDNTRIVTSDRDATYIEGSVDNSDGQTIAVKLGLRVIAEKVMPASGGAESFRIKIPAKFISKKRLNVFNVLEKDSKDGRTTAKDRVEISCIEREEQSIEVGEKEYNLTYPGEDASLNAKATSGEDLMYLSSNPDVATVDEDGKIITTGGGEATITVKQIGNNKYTEAEKDIKVSVEELDAYTITFHSSADDGDTEQKQIVATGEPTNLEENPFINGEHKFFGWATSDDGLVEYRDAEQVTDLAETGDNVDLYAVWSGDGARAAVAWAVMIANDDSFTYGQKPDASAPGCYFCGTNCGPNAWNKPSGYEKTYVCCTFVVAAYAHGTCDPVMLDLCQRCKVLSGDIGGNSGPWEWEDTGRFVEVYPSYDELQPGDVMLCDYSDWGHVSMYAGNGKVVEAVGIDDCWGPGSIAVYPLSESKFREYTNTGIVRYIGGE